MGEVPMSGAGSLPRGPRASAELIGGSAAMRRLRETIARVAPSDATVLLTGPSGSGKENAARALHAASPRATGPFEAVNCGAIPHDLAEAELFGAEAGAYTGASRTRIGRLEAAHGGTLFLDEVGDLPLPLQVKLLRALETRSVERLGGGRPIAVDFRLVAATNVDLEAAVDTRQFRADLYWRLAVVLLDLPPLAARLEDIEALVAHFADAQRLRLHLPADGLARLQAHHWPGNLRELRNFVDRALALGERLLPAETVDRLLTPRRRTMEAWLQAPAATPAPRTASLADSLAVEANPLAPMALKQLLAEAEATLIAQALAASNGTIAESARLLGLKRTTLVEKLKRMGLKAANEAA
ncbi:sigma-54-dependent Fis family transcriptional regulator [Sandaracinobacter neustonicus]|uniref:Sigma-54-dependent Fis family transcriptional regulator n=1 Tax=Sandaracinobacter neustonicus TaxID=1715348 RepID=A0A501XKD7_9SPHN|nr:sigma-54 dependent transcriptional regulator [Sandaracinobacter neustonicus]TPE61148.1 sigma-54-dependent Fis family transcriptional regulator [Sandaracinobacter neustonicus]